MARHKLYSLIIADTPEIEHAEPQFYRTARAGRVERPVKHPTIPGWIDVGEKMSIEGLL